MAISSAHTTAMQTVNTVVPNDDDELVLNLERGNVFKWAAATGTIEIVMAGVPAGDYYMEFFLHITTAASGPTLTYPASWNIQGDATPTIGNSAERWFRGWSVDGGDDWQVEHGLSYGASDHTH